MSALLYISLCTTALGFVLTLFVLAYADYPRTVTKSRANDVFSVAVSVGWILSVSIVLWANR